MKSERILVIAFTFFIIPVLAVFLLSTVNLGRLEFDNNPLIELREGWLYENSPYDAIKYIDLPRTETLSINTEIRISHKLPDIMLSEPVLFLTTEQQYVKVLLNDAPIYEYNPAPCWFSRSPGSAIHIVNLPDDFHNGTAKIILNSPFKSFSGIMDRVYLGNRSSVFLNIIAQDILPFIISLTILMFGIILLVVFLSLYLSGTQDSSIFYFALFTILSGLWMASERKIILLFFNDPVFISNLAIFSLFCMPIPILMFIKNTYQPSGGKILVKFAWGFLAFVFSAVLLQILGIAEYVNILPLFHIITFAAVLAVVCLGLSEIKSGNKGIRVFFQGCFVFGALVLLDIAHFYISILHRMSSNAFTQTGLLLFIVIITSSIGQSFFYLREIQIKNKMLLSLAYTDGLTRLKNRTAFDEMIRALNSNIDEEEAIHLIILDINNLKTINDNFGHKAGDQLLVEGARILRDTLGKLGEVYRIGGDEFAMIIRNTDEETINQMISELFEQIDRYNKQNKLFPISIAYGMSSFRKGQDKDLHCVFVRADKAMYHCKLNQKHIKVVE